MHASTHSGLTLWEMNRVKIPSLVITASQLLRMTIQDVNKQDSLRHRKHSGDKAPGVCRLTRYLRSKRFRVLFYNTCRNISRVNRSRP